ncbi:MaoC/PaaZ C-terminal domain-containing protein [Burkholderia cepacia]|uniref:MaoC/PaaZ C-terminal domain-containing protein n=1 Tax=Burkholderia cepacia TaxID=292 RepID=UPI0018C64CFD|nr:MaoC/PaaZ C-terminal domain-containing protein [Burkholderia cepacia]
MHDDSRATLGEKNVNQRNSVLEGQPDTGGPIPPVQLSVLVGEELGISKWFSIDQPSINALADAIGDWQSIHVDEELSRSSPLSSTIAHWFLTLSLLSAMAFDVLPKLDSQQNSVK